MPAQNERGYAPGGASVSMRSIGQAQGQSTTEAEATARLEQAKEAAKSRS